MQATVTVERVGRRIAEASGLKGCNWEFIVVRDDNMNAFVLPGGKVSRAAASARSYQVRSGHVRSCHITYGTARPGEVGLRADQVRSDQIRSDQIG